jgi:hypothetical protein
VKVGNTISEAARAAEVFNDKEYFSATNAKPRPTNNAKEG